LYLKNQQCCNEQETKAFLNHLANITMTNSDSDKETIHIPADIINGITAGGKSQPDASKSTRSRHLEQTE